MKFTRRGVLAGAAVGLAAGAVGCSGSDETTGGANSANGGAGPVKMVMFPGPQGAALQSVVDEYNQGQGATDGVTVETVLLSRTDTFSKQATMMAANSSEVDLYFTASYILGQHAEHFEPLEGLPTEDHFSKSIEGFTTDGQLRAVPLNVSNIFLFYREDLIDELLSNEEWKQTYATIASELGLPTTPNHPDDWGWDDYIAQAAFFTQAKNPESPTRYGTILQAKNLMFNVMIWNNLLWSEGGGWIADGEASLDSDEARRAVEVYQRIYTEGYTSPDSANAEFPETQAAFQAENAAFALQWGTAFGGLNDPEASPAIAGKIAIARSPGTLHSTHFHTQGFGLNKASENKEAALKWMEYLSSEEAMLKFAAAGGIAAMPKVLQEDTQDPTFPLIAEHIEEYGFNPPALPRAYEAFTMISDRISPAWVGSETAVDALAAAQSGLEELV